VPGGGGKGGSGGGGGSGSVDITSTSSSVIDSTSTSNLNSTSESNLVSTSTSNNQLDSTSNAALQIVGLDNIRLKADTTADNKTQLEMDLKPLQLDFCLKLGLERFPSTRICKPTSKHFGLTLFGVEVLGFNYQADDQTIIEDLSRHPFVVADGIEIPEHHHREPKTGDGVRIRLGD
jgi:hypothetical protein